MATLFALKNRLEPSFRDLFTVKKSPIFDTDNQEPSCLATWGSMMLPNSLSLLCSQHTHTHNLSYLLFLFQHSSCSPLSSVFLSLSLTHTLSLSLDTFWASPFPNIFIWTFRLITGFRKLENSAASSSTWLLLSCHS